MTLSTLLLPAPAPHSLSLPAPQPLSLCRRVSVGLLCDRGPGPEALLLAAADLSSGFSSAGTNDDRTTSRSDLAPRSLPACSPLAEGSRRFSRALCLVHARFRRCRRLNETPRTFLRLPGKLFSRPPGRRAEASRLLVHEVSSFEFFGRRAVVSVDARGEADDSREGLPSMGIRQNLNVASRFSARVPDLSVSASSASQ